ncbi:MAG: BrnT family toxin [Anaerolineae bacterium]
MAHQNPLASCTGFDWDEGNATKNWERHQVAGAECEEVFFLAPLLVAEDPGHSRSERRYFALGRTLAGRRLCVFTVRNDLIRVISARPMSRRERRVYERAREEPETSPDA